MKKIIIVGNWKCNPITLKEAKLIFNSVGKGVKDIDKAEVVICPPFLYIRGIQNTRYKIKIGGQDCFWEEKGAFTGEVSPKMLKNTGCDYVILGHSERRQYFNESEETINKKMKAALQTDLKPILCVGENKNERGEGRVFDVLKYQIQKDLKEISDSKLKNITVAYEPVWAIGTGNFCEPEKAREVLIFLSEILKTNTILYGGSVNSQNARDYIEKGGFHGLLVGGASLKPEEFIKIVENAAKA